MAQVTVSEEAIRELVREALGGAHLEDLTLPEEPPAPIEPNPVVDPMAAVTDPINPHFVPQTKPEFDVAVRNLVKDVPVDRVPDVYRALEAIIDQENSPEDAEMTKEDEKAAETKEQVEEAIRAEVRKVLSEVAPTTFADTYYSDEEEELPPGDLAGLRGQPKTHVTGDEEDEEDLPDDTRRRAYKTTAIGGMHDVGGASFQDIANDLGLSVAGSKRAVDMALDKARFMATGMEDDERDIMILMAMNDYINKLARTGELSPADVRLMKDHPEIVQELDGFREFLHGAIKRARKGGVLDNPLGEGTEPGDQLKMSSVKGRPEAPKPAGKETKAKGASGKDISVDWGSFSEMDEADDYAPRVVPNGPRGPEEVGDPDEEYDPMDGASDEERAAYDKFSQQGPPCPSCGADDTRSVDQPSMMSGDDYGVTCLGCDKTSWADPFTGKFKGPHAMKSESFIVEAKKKAAAKKKPCRNEWHAGPPVTMTGKKIASCPKCGEKAKSTTKKKLGKKAKKDS